MKEIIFLKKKLDEDISKFKKVYILAKINKLKKEEKKYDE